MTSPDPSAPSGEPEVQVRCFPPRKVEKPWGYELIWAENDRYVGKILHVNEGEALSLQYHEVKDETLFLLTGEIFLEIGPLKGDLEEVTLAQGQSVRIRPETVHRMTALRSCDLLEVSTPYLDDVVRLKDRYGREDRGKQDPSGGNESGEDQDF